MTALAPLAWVLLGLLAVPLVLHLVRPRPATVRTATLPFFRALRRSHAEAPWLQRLKRLIALLIAVALVAAAVAGLARPVAAVQGDPLAAIVVLVDRSASMGARLDADPAGPTRLSAAVAELRRRLAGVAATTAIAVVAHDNRSEILLPPTTDRRQVERALLRLLPRPVAGDAAAAGAAAEAAERIARIAAPAAIWIVGDQPAAAGPATAPGIAVAHLGAGGPATNAGIVACDIRRLPLEADRCEIFIAVAASLARSATVRLALDGRIIGVHGLDFPPGGGDERLTLPIAAGAGAVLTVAVETAGDRLAADDRCELIIPPRPSVRAAVVGAPDGFTSLALATIARDGWLSLGTATGGGWHDGIEADVVIGCGWSPPALPRGRPLLLIDPPALPAPLATARLDAPLAVEPPRVADPGHPLLFGVASARVALTATQAIAGDGGLRPLWTCPAGAILAAGEVGEARVAVLGYAPERSERLGLTAAHPVLLANALLWLVQPRLDDLAGRRHATGSIVAVRGREFRWADQAAARRLDGDGAVRAVELDRVGRWSTDAGERGSAALLAPGETRLGAGATAAAPAAAAAGWGGELTAALIAVILALLVIEAVLAHRWGVG